MLSALEEVWNSFLLLPSSGASRATASGRRRSSLTARMAAGAPGPSSARAPGPAGEACDPAAAAATTRRTSGFCLPPFSQLEVPRARGSWLFPLLAGMGTSVPAGAVPCVRALSCAGLEHHPTPALSQGTGFLFQPSIWRAPVPGSHLRVPGVQCRGVPGALPGFPCPAVLQAQLLLHPPEQQTFLASLRAS